VQIWESDSSYPYEIRYKIIHDWTKVQIWGSAISYPSEIQYKNNSQLDKSSNMGV